MAIKGFKVPCTASAVSLIKAFRLTKLQIFSLAKLR